MKNLDREDAYNLFFSHSSTEVMGESIMTSRDFERAIDYLISNLGYVDCDSCGAETEIPKVLCSECLED